MKKISILMAATAVATVLTGCSRENEVIQNTQVPEKERVELTVGLESSDVLVSKSTQAFDNDTEGDYGVKTVELFVYDSNDRLDGYKRFTEKAASYTVSCSVGTGKEVIALINMPAVGKKTSKADLKTTLDVNTITSTQGVPIMGSATTDVSATQHSVTITATRLAAKIQVDRISIDSDALFSSGLALTAVHLYNATGSESINVTTASPGTKVYNGITSSLDKTKMNGLSIPALYTAVSGNQMITSSAPYTKDKFYFYVFPNSAAAGASGVTKLCIETRLGSATGQLNEYNIEIPSIKANCCYHFTEIKLCHYGSTSPGETTTAQDVTFTLNVTAWQSPGNFNGSPTI